ncbi:serine/threonine-protein phosphatase 4 regulatory subunit 1-like isoform X2 [Hylaeus anthracinus]|nr:serine/threonine-protein phosphatase 4 regulatory subunit 1-like isoform X2 [Hylaeus volcanicus]XP_054013251.1 serine/threonine-protein phosphatase 4 regulatory subunit 1-like isoform X2 [Hylaeus anthracinus]
METDKVDDNDVDDNRSTNTSGTDICNVGGSGDEGGGDEQLLQLQHYVSMDTTRQKIGRILLVEMFRTAVNNGTKINVNEIMQSLERIVKDPDIQVRSDLVEQLSQVAIICQEAPHLFGDILHEHLLDMIIKYLQDVDNQVRLTAQTAVLALMKRGLLDNETIETKVCPVLETLCKNVDSLNTGVSLMSKMAPLIGKELTEKIFLDTYITLCRDKEFYVRRICVTHFGELCAAVGKKAINRKLFPIFADMCQDTVWGIRKACVDVMMPVVCCTSLVHCRLVCAELLATHLIDESRWVRMSAFQILGPFISTFAKQFTEVTYNEHGELVFTSQQDSRFSIRYSYEGIFPMKCAIRSLTLDSEDLNSKENNNTSVILQQQAYEQNDDESEEDYISYMKALRLKIQKERSKNAELKETTDDTEKFSPFLYYYIAPDLPPDDELVEAAKKADAQKNMNRKTQHNAAQSDNASNDDICLTIEFPVVEFPAVKYPADGFPSDEYSADECSEEEQPANEPSKDELPTSEPCANNFQAAVNWNVEDIVPQHLIDSFLSMAEPEKGRDMSADLLHYCAFSFPAVVLTLGKENWPYLRHAYKSLVSANQYKVRSTLASSIHEIAAILGQELTATDLMPIYNAFIRDLDEVRIGVLKHLATFLKILKPDDACHYLPRLKEFLKTDNVWNWRFREELGTQLLEIVNLFGPADVERYMVPLSFELLIDKVAAVRHVALSLVTQIVAHLSDNERLVSALFQDLRYNLGVYAYKWIRRQTFAFVCAYLIASNAISGDRFSQEMLPNLLKLSTDKVPNVRLAVARTLSKYVAPMGPDWLGIEQAEEVAIRLREMRSDPDRDVRIFAGSDEIPVLEVTSQTEEEQCRNSS